MTVREMGRTVVRGDAVGSKADGTCDGDDKGRGGREERRAYSNAAKGGRTVKLVNGMLGERRGGRVGRGGVIVGSSVVGGLSVGTGSVVITDCSSVGRG